MNATHRLLSKPPAATCVAGLRPHRSHHTNAIESLHRGLRKIIKTRGSFPSDEAVTKLLYLALKNLGVHWKPAVEWRAAYAQFVIFFPDRLPTTIR